MQMIGFRLQFGATQAFSKGCRAIYNEAIMFTP